MFLLKVISAKNESFHNQIRNIEKIVLKKLKAFFGVSWSLQYWANWAEITRNRFFGGLLTWANGNYAVQTGVPAIITGKFVDFR